LTQRRGVGLDEVFAWLAGVIAEDVTREARNLRAARPARVRQACCAATAVAVP